MVQKTKGGYQVSSTSKRPKASKTTNKKTKKGMKMSGHRSSHK